MKTVSFKTVGCRLNQAETTQLAESFAEAGFKVEKFGTPTDAVIVHTCAVTARAEKDCIRIARSCAKHTPKPFIVLAGCAAEVSAEVLQAECGPDLIVGQDGKFDLPKTLAQILSVSQIDGNTEPVSATRTRAIVKVQTGCDFYCTYCIVPAARGKPTSVPPPEITERVRELAGKGYKEVVLTGANLGCYGTGHHDLIDLLKSIEEVNGIERIRLSSVEITTAERTLVDYMKTSSKVCRHLHVPLQSGSNTVLARMNRKYSSADYQDFCAYALARLPDLGLGTDVIVGFPGETDKEYRETVELIKEIPFSNLHVFQYSPRAGTPAAEMDEQIASQTKKERSDRLLELALAKKASFANKLVGKECSVLIEKTEEGVGYGWTKEYIRAEITQNIPQINEIVDFTPSTAAEGVLRDT